MGLLFEPSDENACSLQCHVEVVDAEEQEKAVARRRLLRAHQGGMLVRAPLVEAEQDGPIRIQDLTKVVMVRRRFGLAGERLVPFEATGNVADADDRPRTFHRNSPVAQTFAFSRAHRPLPTTALTVLAERKPQRSAEPDTEEIADSERWRYPRSPLSPSCLGGAAGTLFGSPYLRTGLHQWVRVARLEIHIGATHQMNGTSRCRTRPRQCTY